jgi:hypothetical protein
MHASKDALQVEKLIQKRRDAGAVDQARLESDSGDAHAVTLQHLAAHLNQRFAATRCSSML